VKLKAIHHSIPMKKHDVNPCKMSAVFNYRFTCQLPPVCRPAGCPAKPSAWPNQQQSVGNICSKMDKNGYCKWLMCIHDIQDHQNPMAFRNLD
jgi:hypothetical protein